MAGRLLALGCHLDFSLPAVVDCRPVRRIGRCGALWRGLGPDRLVGDAVNGSVEKGLTQAGHDAAGAGPHGPLLEQPFPATGNTATADPAATRAIRLQRRQSGTASECLGTGASGDCDAAE